MDIFHFPCLIVYNPLSGLSHLPMPKKKPITSYLQVASDVLHDLSHFHHFVIYKILKKMAQYL